MTFTEPQPFKEALEKLDKRSIALSPLRSREWAEKVPAALRDRAFFSSTLENARVAQAMKDFISDFAAKAIDPATGGLKAGSRAEFVAEMRALCIREGLGKLDQDTGEIDPQIDENDLTDLRSMARLQLIFDVQTESAHEYGFWAQGNDPDLLYAYPAQRFLRIRPVRTPRPLHDANNGAVRRKDDLNFWLAMNPDFGVPYGPWGFGSGMGTEDVDRIEAEELGLIAPGEEISSPERELNDRLSAGVRDLDPDTRRELHSIFGSQIRESNGRMEWSGVVSDHKQPAQKQTVATSIASTSPAEALLIAGIDPERNITAAQARALIAELKESTPANLTSKVSKISGAKKDGTLTRSFLNEVLQEFGEFFPAGILDGLPDFEIEVLESLEGALGQYRQGTQTITLNGGDLAGDEKLAKKTMFHEMLHWLHDHNPNVADKIGALWQARTINEPVVPLLPWKSREIVGKRDKWMDADGDEYAGRVYPWEQHKPKGSEVLTRHLEKLSDP